MQYRLRTRVEPARTWPWLQQIEADIRADQTRRIVEWLRDRTGAHGGAFTSANDVVDAIEAEFGTKGETT